MLGELDDQDGVLARQADENDEANLRENVDVLVRGLDSGHAAQQAHRHDQDHRQRHRPALVLRGQDEEDHDHGRPKDDHRGVARLNLQVGQLGPLIGHRADQVRGLLLDQSDRLARTDAGRGGAVDRGGGIHVVSGEDQRPVLLADVGQGADGDHPSAGVAHLEAAHVVDLVAELRLGLNDHLPGPAEQVEVVDVERTEVDSHRVEEVFQRDVFRHALLPVHVHENLWDVGSEDGSHADKFPLGGGDFLAVDRAFAEVGEELGLALQGLRAVVASVLDDDREPAGAADPAHRRRAEDGHHRFGGLFGEPRPQGVRHGVAVEHRRLRPDETERGSGVEHPSFDPGRLFLARPRRVANQREAELPHALLHPVGLQPLFQPSRLAGRKRAGGGADLSVGSAEHAVPPTLQPGAAAFLEPADRPGRGLTGECHFLVGHAVGRGIVGRRLHQGVRRADGHEGKIHRVGVVVEDLDGLCRPGEEPVEDPVRALMEFVEDHEHRAEVRAVGRQEERLPGRRLRVLHAGDRMRDGLQLVHQSDRPLLGRGVGQLDVAEQVAHVLRRDEPVRRRLEPPEGQAEQSNVQDDHHAAEPEHTADDPGIARSGGLEPRVEEAKTPGQDPVQGPARRQAHDRSRRRERRPERPRASRNVPPLADRPGSRVLPADPASQQPEGRQRENVAGPMGRSRLQQQSGKRGAERQRVERRDDRRSGDRQRELSEELADDPRHERAGDEHGREHQADRDHRPGHFLHRPDGRVPRLHPLFNVMLDGLDDHDRVIDHDPDRQHQTEEREVVEREPQRGHHREGADDRHRHGHQRNHRRPPVLKEQQHDDGDENDRLAEGLEHLVDRFADERRGVVANLEIDPRRGLFLQLGDLRFHDVGGLQRVGVGKLPDGDADGRTVVDLAVDVFILGSKFDPSDILDPDDPAGGRGLDDDVLELGHVVEPPFGGERNLDRLAERGGRLADLAGRHLGVLRPDRRDHVAGRHVARGQLVGIDPDPHAVVALAEHPHVAHSGHAREVVANIHQGVVAQEELVVAALGEAVLGVGRRVHGENQKDVGRHLPDVDAGLLDHVGQERRGQRQTVLHEDLGHVQVHAVLERDGQLVRAVVGALRRHVHHVLDAVDLLLDRRRHGLGDDLGAGAGIVAVHRDRRWRDRRVERQRQREQRDRAGERDHDRQHGREDGPVDEELREHSGLSCAGTEFKTPAPVSAGGSGRPPRRRGSPALPGARPARRAGAAEALRR